MARAQLFLPHNSRLVPEGPGGDRRTMDLLIALCRNRSNKRPDSIERPPMERRQNQLNDRKNSRSLSRALVYTAAACAAAALNGVY